MKTVTIIGDSHTLFLNNSNSLDKIKNEVKINKDILYNVNFLYLGPQLAYTFNIDRLNNFIKLNDFIISSESILTFYMGEIDLRCKVGLYKNPEEIVNRYVSSCLDIKKYFNTEIQFIEPVAQSNFGSIDIAYPRVGDYETRRYYHSIFMKELSDLCRKNYINLINQDELIIKDGLKPIHSLDGVHLNKEKNDELLQKILS